MMENHLEYLGGICFKGTNEADTLGNEPINRIQHGAYGKEEENMFHQA